jgi:hypothetical protein
LDRKRELADQREITTKGLAELTVFAEKRCDGIAAARARGVRSSRPSWSAAQDQSVVIPTLYVETV